MKNCNMCGSKLTKIVDPNRITYECPNHGHVAGTLLGYARAQPSKIIQITGWIASLSCIPVLLLDPPIKYFFSGLQVICFLVWINDYRKSRLTHEVRTEETQ